MAGVDSTQLKKYKDLKAHNEIEREFFRQNIQDLIEKVLRKSRIEAAKTIGVDYGWLRKACSLGVTRPSKKNMASIQTTAQFFRLPTEALWKPFLLVQIWLDKCLPEVKNFFVNEFNFDEYARSSQSFQDEISYATNPVVRQLTEESSQLSSNKISAAGGTIPGTEEMVSVLLATGRYEYLRTLINDLFVAEQQKATFVSQTKNEKDYTPNKIGDRGTVTAVVQPSSQLRSSDANR